MTFRSRGNSDQRRRRVLLDDTRNEENRGTAAAAPSGRRHRRYGDDALGDAQPRVTDLLPKNGRFVAILIAAVFLVDAAIVALHWFAPRWQQRLPQMPLAVLDATSAGGLAHLAILGQMACVVAVSALIFTIRRRRLDDLRGTYQMWVWATAIFATATILAGTDLPEIIGFGLSMIPRMPSLATERYYFWMLTGFLAIPLGIRLLVEIRKTRTAQILLLLTIPAFASREILYAQWLELPLEIASTIFAATTLLASSSLLGALLVYGRYVKLDASGAFSGKKRAKRRRKADSEEEPSDAGVKNSKSQVRMDSPAANAVPRPSSLGAATDSARGGNGNEHGLGPLSKSQRKAMRG